MPPERACFPTTPPPYAFQARKKSWKLLRRQGLRTRISRREIFRVRYGSTNGFLRSLNRQGVTGVSNSGCKLLTRTELRKLIGYYDRRFEAPAGGVFATYSILYVTARKEK